MQHWNHRVVLWVRNDFYIIGKIAIFNYIYLSGRIAAIASDSGLLLHTE